MTNIPTCCIDVDVNFCISISIYNGTGRFLRISERLDLQMFGLWFLDFQISRFTIEFRKHKPTKSRNLENWKSLNLEI